MPKLSDDKFYHRPRLLEWPPQITVTQGNTTKEFEITLLGKKLKGKLKRIFKF